MDDKYLGAAMLAAPLTRPAGQLAHLLELAEQAASNVRNLHNRLDAVVGEGPRTQAPAQPKEAGATPAPLNELAMRLNDLIDTIDAAANRISHL
jgi:hypothetical protein